MGALGRHQCIISELQRYVKLANLFFSSFIFSGNRNVERFTVEHVGPTFLTFLLCLFYVLCYFASVFDVYSTVTSETNF